MNIDPTNAPNTTETAIGFIPCYQLPFLSLFHADCMEIMKQYPDKYFDLAIVDPPYGLGDRLVKGGAKGGMGTMRNLADDKVTTWDDKIPPPEYFTELQRVSKKQIIWGGNYFLDYLGKTDGFIVWDKMNGTNPMADAELAWQNVKGTTRMYRWHHFSGERNIKIHPTQKPKELYSFVIKNYATEGMKLLDTHFGSGSIALAVDKANRLDKMNLHLTACEIDKEYIDKAIKRISESIKQGTLSF
jgi:site-specific DNA-methyltransferase (adenine-specific)